MAFKGIDIRESGDRILVRVGLQDSAGAIVTSGSTTLKIYELQLDATFKSYDFNDNTFKATALTTETLAMTHRKGNNSTTNTGLWTVALTTLTDFTAGNIYIFMVNNSGAAPTDQWREFQFAGDGVGAANALATYDGPTKTEMDVNLDAQISTRAVPADFNTLEARLSAARAGYLDNLAVGGLVSSQAEVQAIQNNTRTTISLLGVIERPDAGSTGYKIYLNNYDTQGNMEEPDSAPTVAVANQDGTSRTGNLQNPSTHGVSSTMLKITDGRYWIEYDLDNTDPLEQLTFTFTIIEGGATRYIDRGTIVVDTTAVDFTAADRTRLTNISDKLPSKAYLRGSADSDGGMDSEDKTDIQAKSKDALDAYDPPTAAELSSTETAVINAINALSIPGASAIADAVLLEAVADHMGTVGSLAHYMNLIRTMTGAGAKIKEITEDIEYHLYDVNGVKRVTLLRVGDETRATIH